MFFLKVSKSIEKNELYFVFEKLIVDLHAQKMGLIQI